jgi:hypothetical protein
LILNKKTVHIHIDDITVLNSNKKHIIKLKIKGAQEQILVLK